MQVDADAEAKHAEVGALGFGDADFQEEVELLVEVFELLDDGGDGEDVVLAEHFGGLLTDEVFMALQEVLHEGEDLAVNGFGGKVELEAVVVHDVAGVGADEG